MNTGLIVQSLKHLQKFELVIQLATWINQVLTEISYDEQKLTRSFVKNEHEVFELLLKLNRYQKDQVKNALNELNREEVNISNKMLKLLIDNCIELHYFSIFYYDAIYSGDVERVSILIEYFKAKDYRISGILDTFRSLCRYMHFNMIKLFLKHYKRMLIDLHNNYILIENIRSKNTKVIHLLLDNGFKITKKVVDVAIKCGCYNVIINYV